MASTLTKHLDVEVLGRHIEFDCEGVNTLSIEYELIDGTITDGVVTVQRTIGGHQWSGFPVAVTLTDGDVVTDLDVSLLSAIRVRVSTAETGGTLLARATITAEA